MLEWLEVDTNDIYFWINDIIVESGMWFKDVRALFWLGDVDWWWYGVGCDTVMDEGLWLKMILILIWEKLKDIKMDYT